MRVCDAINKKCHTNAKHYYQNHYNYRNRRTEGERNVSTITFTAQSYPAPHHWRVWPASTAKPPVEVCLLVGGEQQWEQVGGGTGGSGDIGVFLDYDRA